MSETEGTVPAGNEPWEYVLHIPHDLRAVTVCRRTVRLILTMHGLIRLADVAELLATELVSNAVRHTKGPVALRLRMRDGFLRVGAWDTDPEPPMPPPSVEVLTQLTYLEEGRGLALVSSCADLWGWQPLSRGGIKGKYVWGDLAAA
ncbi:ATP-binding protein [Streptomyces sp. SID12501]|uniref:ATP-binding protein n=1 Tax=Streptomyces sp. SID12501 TaxID=2706042 RepID=A0A6B3BGQ3_9ACTN|nr:ATP-binding protein [Streptomyces sp. SID12501]NEC85667.1 ATP-binding protein [Streptomyces sp. SID12501]